MRLLLNNKIRPSDKNKDIVHCGDFLQIEYAGSEVEIVKELSHIMNFDYEFLEVESETKWGGQYSTNNTPQFYGAVARFAECQSFL